MYMQKYVVLEKKVGETPLVVLEHFREKQGLGKAVSLAYAGRLDPMASGKLLVLIGEECKKQEKYHGLDKEYVFEVLLGVESDSGDVLGIAESHKSEVLSHKEIDIRRIKKVAKRFRGDITLPYPLFSSKTVKGKPLFLWTLEGRLDEIDIPKKRSQIYQLEFIDSRKIEQQKLQKRIFEKIDSIPKVTDSSKELGKNFRRDAIRKRWDEVFENTKQKEFEVLQFRCIASSGTYMRTLAQEIGKVLSTGGLAFSIHRTKIGTYTKVFGSLGFWSKIYI